MSGGLRCALLPCGRALSFSGGNHEATRDGQDRNVALVAHGSAGKTTLTEAMLFSAGATSRLGRVEEGTTTTDFDEDEIRRKISISTAMAWCEWKGHKINLVDTPGFAAFLADAKNALRVVDGAVVVVGATGRGEGPDREGVELRAAAWSCPAPSICPRWTGSGPTSPGRWRMCGRTSRPTPCRCRCPSGRRRASSGVVDLVRMRAMRFAAGRLGKATEEDDPRPSCKAMAETPAGGPGGGRGRGG